MKTELKRKLEQRIEGHFKDSIAVKSKALEIMPQSIADAINLMYEALCAGKKILACGNGGSAADAQHFAAELVGRFERERKELPAIALTTDTSIITAIGNDYSFDVIFSKQVRALGQPGDILLGISTSGNSGNIIEAINAAHEKGMLIIALTGKDGGKIGQLLKADDVNLCVPADRTARIQETHLLLLHCLCDGVDHLILD
jgi:D-sedoheptulose 7-phosphate isomerase